ncbi:hypothetical protein M422DRAFT_29798 [Sphaerobolus stellatus SS14]|uniref:Ribonuclease H1 N-terminal domain-containing protein n=1 Tax=Sphaerobolus stellatus (strain SS14) TaxID=990650 RepID=A0A0C9VT41_SPHS4|nr:hypothetical protein M422DRAFT_29798 [Sphaerobolus stellatus SS14]
MAKPKFYAVRHGRDGPKIYSTWSECEKAVKGLPGARHKSFPTMQTAQNWLDEDSNMREDRGHDDGTNNAWSAAATYEYGVQRLPTPVTPPPVTPPPVHIPLDEPFTADYILLPPTPAVIRRPQSHEEPVPTSISNNNNTVVLSEEQEHILNLVKEGKNVFFTGSAGLYGKFCPVAFS